MTTFHEALAIHKVDEQSYPPVWAATHAACGQPLQLVAGDWHCYACKVDFHDDHCADLAAEVRDKAAREAMATAHATGDEKEQKRAAKALDAERKSIREELLKKRGQRESARQTK